MKVAVGSENPAKITAVKIAFEKVWPDITWSVKGIDVKSGVSNQPMSDSESLKGARNRADRALDALQADFGVGLEGGIQQVDDLFFDGGWIVVKKKTGEEGIGCSPRMIVPKKMMEIITDGKELGEACDILFNKTNSKQANGHFGLMTDDNLTRTEGYMSGIIMALSRFLHPELF